MGSPVEVTHTTKTAPVGHCVYCGATDNLSDEHVVPFALGGHLVLPKASCPKCAAITSAFEGKVLRGFMANARIAGGFPTRRPKQRPEALPLEILRGDSYATVALSAPDYPALLHMPTLAPAGVLAGRELTSGVMVCGAETLSFGKTPVQAVADTKTRGMRCSINLDVFSFVRLIAKIGYCAAIASVGPLPRENVPVLPLILGVSEVASHWLGSTRECPDLQKGGLGHFLGVLRVPDPENPSKEMLLARVRLFANTGVTGYEVVAFRQPATPHTEQLITAL